MKPSYLLLRSIATLAAFFVLCSIASAQNIFWSAGDAGSGNLNWSDPTNWLGGVIPSAGNAVFFDNAGQSSSPGGANADNIVNANFTISSLWYTATNLSPNYFYQNTVINSGVTLTVSSSAAAIVLDSGTQNDPNYNGPDGGLTASYATISGGGALVVDDTNTESVMIVSQGSSQYTGNLGLWASLNMSNLNTFDGTFGRLLVGVQGSAFLPGELSLNDSGRQAGLLALAATNLIHLTATSGPALAINETPFWGDDGSYIYLGQSNAFWADGITVGRSACSRAAVMEFNPFNSGAQQFWLRGESSNRVSTFTVADNSDNGAYGNANPNSSNDGNQVYALPLDTIVVPPGGFQVGSAGVFDVTAGTSDIMIDTLTVGEGWVAAGGGYSAGIFSMGAGTLNVNTLQLGVMASASGTAPVTGVFNDIGGNVTVNSGPVTLGVELASPPTTYATGTLTMMGGTLNIANGAYGIIDDGLSDSAVMLTNATVTAANIGSASAPVGTVVLGDSTLNLALNSLQGAVVAKSVITASTSVGNTINITAISDLVGGQSVVTIIQSENAIVYNGTFNGGVGGSDFLPVILPAGYQGHLQINGSSVQLVITQSPIIPNSWTGAGIPSHNTNWSDGANWSSSAEPDSSDVAFFLTSDSVGSASTINNIVDGNVSVLGLDYANTGGSFQNTLISPNATLTVGEGGLTVGSPVVDEGNTTGTADISGAEGTLSIDDSSALIYIGLGHSNADSTAEATLDMSGLGAFNADAASLLVGVGSVGFTSILQPVGILYLAKTNMITVSSGNGGSDNTLVALDVGDAGDAETTAGFGDSMSSALYLGSTNAIFADYIDVGRQWASGGIYFNPAVTTGNPTVYLRGASANAIASWNIGDGADNLLTDGGGTGINDFTGGTINAAVDTLNIAISSPNSSAASAVTGTLTFDAGAILAGTINVSDNPASSGGFYSSYGVGTLNVNGAGTLIVSGGLNLGVTPGVQAGGTPTATLNVNEGSVWANTISAGVNGTVSTVNVVGGTLAGTNGIGTPAASVTSLNLTNATIVEGAGSTPFINATNVALGGASNTIVILSLPAVEVYPVTETVIKSATPIVGILNVQAVVPTNFTGISISESTDHTEILLTIQAGPITPRGIVHWVGPDGTNMDWSDAKNWFVPPVPAPPDTALFDNAGEVLVPGAANADNIVDTSLTIAGLWYAETNASVPFNDTPAAYHNTLINPGVTVTIDNTNAVIVLDCGTQNDPGTVASGGNPAGNESCYATISGSGALAVDDPNPESVAIVSQGSFQYSYPSAGLWASLDMSGLNSFSGTFGRLLVGVQGVGVTPGEISLNGSGRQTGILSLALTNVIHLTQMGNNQGGVYAAAGGPALVVFDNANTSGDNPSQLHLGLSNALYADAITIGRTGVQSGIMDFNPSLSGTPQLYLRGESSSRVGELIVGDSTWEGGESQYESPDPRISVTSVMTANGTVNLEESGLMDVSAGPVDMMIDKLIVGKGYNAGGSGYVVGQLSLGGGNVNVNTLELGAMSSTTTATTVTGILNVTNATLVVNNVLALGLPMGAATAPFADGILNISASSVSASDITASGGVNSVINMNGGALSLTSPGGSIGTAAAPIGSISLNNSTLNLDMGSLAAPVVTSSLNCNGSSDLINVNALPLIESPTTLTLIQSSTAIAGYDFALGTLPPGYTGTLQQSADSTAVQLVITKIPTLPSKGTTITGASLQLSTGGFTITGTNGLPDGTYIVFTSTNLTTWTPIATNSFNGSGDFSATLPYSSNDTGRYYKIESQ